MRRKNRFIFYSLSILLAGIIFCGGVNAGRLADTLKIQSDAGRVVSSFSGTDPQEILIILDAHSNFEAQKNISRILAQLTAVTESAMIGLEGASGDIAVADLHTFPIREARDVVSGYFLNTSRINGVEYFLITADDSTEPPLTIGIEDRKTYRDNLTAYRTFIAQAEEYAGEISSFQDVLTDAGIHLFTDIQREFDQLIEAREQGDISFSAYAQGLVHFARAQNVSISPFVNFSLLEKSFAQQKTISAYRLDAESKQIAEKLNAQLASDDAFHAYNYQYMLGTIAPEQYYTELARQCRAHQFDLKTFPQFTAYLRYLDTTANINHAGLFDESVVLAGITADALFAASPHRVVYDWKHRTRLLAKLCSLTLSSKEYELLEDDTILSRAAESIAGLKSYLSDSVDLAGLAETIQAIREQSGVFYDIAHKRNEIMLANLLADMDMEDIRSGCLVVGGFHADGIAQLLEEQNISYMVVSPAMAMQTDLALYHDRLNGDNSAFEASLEQSITALMMQNQSTIPSHTLAIASQLSRTPLDSEERAEAIRVELKSIMSVEAIRQLEQTGLHQLDRLAERIDALLIAQWGEDNFPDLRSYRIYRGVQGRLTIELNINNRAYTFVGSSSVTGLTVPDPSRELAKITLGDTTITVLEGADSQNADTYAFAETLLEQLANSPATIADIKSAATVSEQTVDRVLQRWQGQGYIFLGPAQNPQIVTLSATIRSLLPALTALRESFVISPDSLSLLPDSLVQRLNDLNVQEILVDRTTPVSVLVEFLVALERGVIQPAHIKTGVTPFHLVDENFTYDAVLAKRGLARQGNALELRITANPAIPFDADLRDARLAQIISDPAILTEAANSATPYVPVARPASASTPLLPLSEDAQREQDIRNHLFSFIGEPLEFKKIPKAVVFDLDGTLAVPDPETQEFLSIDPVIISEIKKLIANGVEIALVTGQALDGAQARFAQFFDTKELSKIHLYSSSGANAAGFNEQGERQEYYREDLTQEFTTEQLDELGNEITEIARNMNIIHYEFHMRDSVQMSYRLTESSETQRIAFFNAVSDLIESKNLPVKVGLAGRTTIDIALKNKSDAIRDFLQNRVQANASDILFFGDSYDGNDYPMAEAAPESAHFHVGHGIRPNGLPDSVIQTDSKGPLSTGAILTQLNQLIALTVDRQVYEDRVQNIVQNNTAYYDFHQQFSTETPADQLNEKFILPIWYHTNESEWEQAVPEIEQGNFTNTLLGVSASSVNLSYIAAGNFKQAVVIDTNPVVTQLYVPLRNALVSLADNRIEFISLLSRKSVKQVVRDGEVVYQPDLIYDEGVQIPEISPTASAAEILEFFNDIDPSPAFSEGTFAIIQQFFPEELRESLAELWDTNYRRGFSYRNILTAEIKADLRAGRPLTWLSDESRFQKVRTFIREGRLYAVEANWAADTVARLADVFAVQGDSVDVAYLSNVHHKIPASLSAEGVAPRANYYSNVAAFPRSDNFLILSDRTLQGEPVSGISPYENTAYEESNSAWRKEQFTEKPIQPMDGVEIKTAQTEAYANIVSEIMYTYGNPVLGNYYLQSDTATRTEILEFFANNVIANWLDIRNRLFRGETPQGNEKQLVTELESLFGIGLAQLESTLDQYDNPYDFFMQLLIQPYDTSRMFIQKTVSDTLAQLIRALELFRTVPDIVLIDSALLRTPTHSGNFAAGTFIEQYRQEHALQQKRRVVFVAVDTQADSVITARKQLDRSLYTRGDDTTVFDAVLAIPYNEQAPDERALYTIVREELGAGIPETQVLEEFKRRKLAALLEQRFGLTPAGFAARVSVIAPDKNFMHDFAFETGMAFRAVAEQTLQADAARPTGTFLIDVLRTIGDRSLPADLRITGVSDVLAVTPEQKKLDFDEFLALFRTVYGVYNGLEPSARTYRGFIDALTAARADGIIAPQYDALLLPETEIRQMFTRQSDTSLLASQLVAVFMQIVPTRLRVVDKIQLENSVQLQYKLLTVKSIVDRQTADGKEFVTIADVSGQLADANVDLLNISAYLQVDVPPRAVSSGLNNAIANQRVFDLSA